MKLEGKVAIVTGSAKGIGKAIALRLAKEGAKIVVTDVDVETMKSTVEEIKQISEAAYIKCDVSNEEDVKALMKFAVDQFGTIDILVNNAGLVPVKMIDEITLDDWNKTIAVNLTGTFLCSKYAVDVMKEKRYGKIVNMGSFAGQAGGILVGPDYTASKGGVIALTKAFAKHCGKYNINVNVVSPYTIPTSGTAKFGDEGMEQLKSLIPIGRIGTTDDVANMVAFLVSDEASYVTGATFDLNGGVLMR